MIISNTDLKDIFLQEISLEDVNSTYVDWLNDPDVNQYLETRFQKQTIESVESYISDTIKNKNEHLFTVRTSKNKKHIGNIKIGGVTPHHGIAFISLFIGDKKSWNKSYASQAIKLACKFAFNFLEFRKLSAGIYQPNSRSLKAFLNVGFKHDCTFKNHYLFEGKPCDLIFVSLFNPANNL